MTLLIGTSGWQYAHWRTGFYRSLPQKVWLEFYAERFQIVELNNSFYRLPKREQFNVWALRTPADFIVAPKASRYLTHIKRLREPAEPVSRFMEAAGGLRHKLGPVLLQLPPRFRADPAALDETLSLFPPEVRVAVEPRDDTWWTDEVRAVLERRGAALCLADRGSKRITPLWRTTGWTYLRFHEGRAHDRPSYGRSALDSWLRRVAEQWTADEDVYVFFNNDPNEGALRDAVRFALLAERAGLPTTRVPPRADVGLADHLW